MENIRSESVWPQLSDEARAAIARADVVIGVEGDSQREFTVFGVSSLESSVTIKKPSAVRTVRVILDRRSHALDELIALVRRVKSHADCEADE